MTCKDFQLIADVFKNYPYSKMFKFRTAEQIAVGTLARIMAGQLATTNPMFDRERFLKACEVL